jgi:hypothetical protein
MWGQLTIRLRILTTAARRHTIGRVTHTHKIAIRTITARKPMTMSH